MPRRTSLELSTGHFYIETVDYLESINTWNFKPTPVVVDARSIYNRYDEDEPVKMVGTFSWSANIANSAVWRSNLDMTTWTGTFDSTARVMAGDLINGSIRVSTKNQKSSAHADVWRGVTALGTEIMIDGEYMMNTGSGVTDAWPVKLAAGFTTAAHLQKLKGTYSISAGGSVLTGNCMLLDPELRAETENFLRYAATLKGQGTPASCTGHPLLVKICTGDAVVGYRSETAVGTFHDGTATGDADSVLLTGLTMEFADEQLVKLSGEAAIIAAITVA